jgi:hydroxymethylbilane synthase
MIEKTVLWMEALDWMLPAPGQGAIAVECRQGDEAERLLSVLNHPSTSRCVEAERLVLRHLGGGCHLALGALATESPEGMSMKAVFIPNPEAAPIMAEAIAASPAEVSRMIVDQLLS